MRNILQKLFSFNKKITTLPPSTKKQKSKGQSLVEFAIAFPIVILLFSGVVEFGFILNYYLSLLDATREAARQYSLTNPWLPDPRPARNDTYWFYIDAAETVKDAVEPRDINDTSRKIVLDPTRDDVIITVYSLCGNNVYSFPAAGGYHLYPGNATSVFTNASMLSSRLAGAPNAGVLLVEINYNYHQVLALPWLTVWLSNPLPLRAYTIMPLRAAEPPMDAPAPNVACP